MPNTATGNRLKKSTLTKWFKAQAKPFAERVLPAYTALNWHWHGDEHPTAASIEALILRLAKDLKVHGSQPISIRSGGIEVGWYLEEGIQPTCVLRFEVREEAWI